MDSVMVYFEGWYQNYVAKVIWIKVNREKVAAK